MIKHGRQPTRRLHRQSVTVFVTVPRRRPAILAGDPAKSGVAMPRTAGALGDAVPVIHTAGKQKPRRWPVGLAWALWAITLLSLPVVLWLYQLLRQAGLSELGIPVAANLPLLVAVVSAATVGAVLASRRPAHPVGWLLLAAGLSEQCTNLVGEYVHYGVMGRPGGLPAASYLSGFYNSG